MHSFTLVLSGQARPSLLMEKAGFDQIKTYSREWPGQAEPTDIHFRGIYRALRGPAANVFAGIHFRPVVFHIAFARRVFRHGSKETGN